MKTFKVTVEKEIGITILDKNRLLKMYKDTMDSDGNLNDAIEYIVKCIAGDMTFDGLVHIEKNNGVFDWEYNELNNEIDICSI